MRHVSIGEAAKAPPVCTLIRAALPPRGDGETIAIHDSTCANQRMLSIGGGRDGGGDKEEHDFERGGCIPPCELLHGPVTLIQPHGTGKENRPGMKLHVLGKCAVRTT